MDLLLLAQDVTWGGRTGDAVHLRELARQLVRRGHRVRIIARAGLSSDDDSTEALRIYPLRSTFNLAFSVVRRPYVMRTLLRAVSDRRPDLLYSRGCGDLAEALAARTLGLPIVFEVNGDLIAERESQLGRGLSGPAKAWMVGTSRRGFRIARSVVAVTETLRQRLSDDFDVPADKVLVIPNAADTDLFHPIPIARAREELGIPVGTPVVLFVGNLAPWQGVEYLVSALAEVLRSRPGALLLVVGDGQEGPALRALAAKLGVQDHVRFMGAVPHEQVPGCIAAADVCVAPLTQERLRSGSSALKIHEYLACERPVVASRIPGLEFLEFEALGKLVPPEDPHALAAALVAALADEGWCRSAGSRGRAYVLKNAGWPAVAARVEDALQRAVAS